MMLRNMMGPLVTTLVLFLVWLAGMAEAQARGQLHSIHLDLSGDEQPTHVCVIASGRAPNSKHAKALKEYELLARSQGDEDWYLVNTLPRVTEPTKPVSGLQKYEGALEGLWPEYSAYRSACQRSDASTSCTPRFAAFEYDEERFMECRANQSLASTKLGPKDLRLLVISIDGPRVRDVELKNRDDTSIEVSNIKLYDSVLEFDSSHNPAELSSLVAVRGGYYRERRAVRVSEEGTAQLMLEPRCAWVELQHPPTLSSMTRYPDRKQLKVRIHPATLRRTTASQDQGVLDKACVRGDLDSIEMRALLPTQVEVETRIDVELGSKDGLQCARDDEDPTTKPPSCSSIFLRGLWLDQTPAQLRLETQSFSFSWKSGSCFYEPEGICPQAFIKESGKPCMHSKTPVEGVCHYWCSGSANQGIGVEPGQLSIEFRERTDRARGPGESEDTELAGPSWTRELNYIDQQLVGHVAPAEQAVVLDLGQEQRRGNDWELDIAKLDQLGDQVYGVELSYVGYNGVQTTVTVNLAEQWLPASGERRGTLREVIANVPNATCQNKISYTYLGEREYRTARASIQSGILHLDPPVTLGRSAYFVADVAGGLVFLQPPGAYGSTENPRVNGHLSIEAGIGHWPLYLKETTRCKAGSDEGKPELCHRAQSTFRGIRMEWKLGLSYAAIPIRPLDPNSSDPNRRYQQVPYIRVGPSFTLLTPWFGPGAGPQATLSQRKVLKIAAGFGLGAHWGRPVMQEQVELIDRRTNFDFGLRPFAELRVRLSRVGHLEVFARHEYYLLEDNISFQTDGRGEPVQRLNEHRGFRQTILMGLALSI